MLRLPGLVAWNLCSDQAAAEIRAMQRPGPDTRPHPRGKCILAIRAFFICEECIFSHDFLGGGNAASKQKSLSSTIRNTGTITKNGSPAIGRTGIHGKLLQAPKKKKTWSRNWRRYGREQMPTDDHHWERIVRVIGFCTRFIFPSTYGPVPHLQAVEAVLFACLVSLRWYPWKKIEDSSRPLVVRKCKACADDLIKSFSARIQKDIK